MQRGKALPHFIPPGISKRSYTKEDIEALNAKDVPYNGGMYTEYEISQMQRRMEREIRATRRELAGLDEAAKFSAGKQKADLQSDFAQSSVKLKRQEAKLRDFTRQTDRRVDTSRVQVMGFGRSVSQKAVWENKKEKPIFDLLSAHGVKYKQRINRKEIIVDAGKPKIVGMRVHAAENLTTKADRAQMSLEQAQLFVNNAKLTLYQDDKFTMKFLAEDGYAVLNFDYELVTAVPQKWRKKYDQYLEEMKT